MPMSPFVSRFPALAGDETRVVTIVKHNEIPPGEYAFVEWYCDEKGCDCRRVLIQVLEQNSGSKIWATINYGWESLGFYEKWTSSRSLAKDMAGPMLDRINPQTQHSSAFLTLFKVLLLNEGYVERLKEHYALFKAKREWTRTSTPNRPKLGVKKKRKNPR
jgi:hypothetical protein